MLRVNVLMIRPVAASVCAALLLCSNLSAGKVIAQAEAEQIGLTRAWFTQAAVDPTRGKIISVIYQDGTLYVATSLGSVQALDASNGQSLWVHRFGDPTHPTFRPAIRNGQVAVVHGSTLYLLDASTGRELNQRELAGAPAGGPVLAEKYCFVPFISGKLLGYPLDPSKVVFWRRSTNGNVYDAPSLAGDHVVWTTDNGTLYGARADAGGLSYRFRGEERLIAPAATTEELLFIASESGLIHALDAARGSIRWRVSLGERIHTPVVYTNQTLYVTSDDSNLYAFDSSTGIQQWAVEGTRQFISESPDHIYTAGPDGELIVVQSSDAQVVEAWSATVGLTPLVNHEDDRLFFYTESGLLQCLHESELESPQPHQPASEAESETSVVEAVVETPAVEEESEPIEEEPVGGFDFDGGAADSEAPADEPVTDDPFADPFDF